MASIDNMFSVDSLDIVEQLTLGAYALPPYVAVFWLAFGARALFFGKHRSIHNKKIKASFIKDVRKSDDKSPPKALRSVKMLSGDDICRGRAGKPEIVAATLRAQLKGIQDDEMLPTLVSLLQSAGKAPTIELLAAVRTVAKERHLQLNCALGEVLLRGCYSARLTKEFVTLLAEVEAEAISDGRTLETSLFNGVGVQALKHNLRQSNFEGSLNRLDKPHDMWNGLNLTPSAAPKALLQWLTRLALEQDVLPKLVGKLKTMGLFTEAYQLVLAECAQHAGADVLRAAEALGHKEGLKFTDSTYCVLLKAARKVEDAIRIFYEALRSVGTSKELVIVASCTAFTHESYTFADIILNNLPAEPPSEAAGKLLQLYSRRKGGDSQFLSYYVKHFLSVDLSGEVITERLITEACIRCKRFDILEKMLATTTDCTKHVGLLKSICTDGKMDDAFVIFGIFSNRATCLYNVLIDACIDNRQTKKAQNLAEDAIQAGVADVVTYNTMIKAHLIAGSAAEAKKVVQRMKEAGMPPNCTTFNELLEVCIKHNGRDVWAVLDEMEICGVKPNQSTCSILLQTIRSNSSTEHVERVLDVVDSTSEGMDEVLLSSVVDICIRAGRVALLVPHLKRQCSSRKLQGRGPHTYGSIIRAYGFVNDVAGAWEMWQEMRARNIVPTSVALGCMVEAVVSNGDPKGGYDLIQDMLADDDCRPMVNAVIYCSVLKGFSHQKSFGSVLAIYKEMLAQKVTFSISTFNTMVDACARCGDMTRIPELLRSMVSQGIEPNLITYSTICKGYCQDNKLDEAFELKKGMVQTTKFKPDEIMYNTLLDGCARQGLYDRGFRVLSEMEADGIAPSDFTLSLLVKLCTRAKRVNRAFEIVQELCTKYRFKPNVHVYGNLIQACIQCKDLKRAFEVLETMVEAGVRPDVRVYGLLLRSCVAAREAQDAAALMRAAVGLAGVPSCLKGQPPNALMPQGGLPQALITEIVEGIAGSPCHDEMLAVSLLQDLRTKSNVKVDPRLQMRLATKAANDPRLTKQTGAK